MWTYSDDLAAMEDALRLSKGMTYKYAAAGINLGGGKIVVIGDPKRQEGREMLFRALGRFIDSLGGEYLTGEDVGTTLQDMDHMRVETRNVITLARVRRWCRPDRPGHRVRRAAGDAGVRRAAHRIAIAARQACGRARSRCRRCADGRVPRRRGRHRAGQRHRPGQGRGDGRARTARRRSPPTMSSAADVDVYCPCALGATINDESLAVLKAPIVCGSANNQLAEPRHGDELHDAACCTHPTTSPTPAARCSTPTACGAASTRSAAWPRCR